MDSNSLLTIKQVAKYLHVVPITVYRMIDRGDLKAVKVGRVWRIRYEDVQRYLDRTPSTSPAAKER
jgi:excisionase family DNA binding protein